MRNKISIIGAGHVGATAALWIMARNLADVVLLDVVEGVPQGKALDLRQALPIAHSGIRVTGTNDYAETANSDIVLITAGLPVKPGLSRDDLLRTNFKIISDVVAKVIAYSPESILIIVSNPLDAMTQAAYRLSGFNRERVLGASGVLDTARFCGFIAAELKVNVEDVRSTVLGAHGVAIVPLVRATTVAGVPLSRLLSAERIEALIQLTRRGGGEIVKHLRNASAAYAPSAAAVLMAEAILNDSKQILCCSAYLEGEYGVDGCCLGVPCRLGAAGLEKIVDLQLAAGESSALQLSAAAVRAQCGVIGV
jgi:malate dehydrogenase